MARSSIAPGADGIEVRDPSTGEVFARLPRGGAKEVDRAVEAARAAYEGPWGAMTATERGRCLTRLGVLITENMDELAELECRDTGKPMKQARNDIVATARYFEYYGSAADKLHGETIPYAKGTTVMALRVPHGVTGHIIPWNYPAQIFGRSVGGALAAGNACVVKPAEDACLTPLRISELALEAGVPAVRSTSSAVWVWKPVLLLPDTRASTTSRSPVRRRPAPPWRRRPRTTRSRSRSSSAASRRR